MTENYIRNNFDSIIENANAVEKRLFDSVDMEELIAENKQNLSLCEKYGENVILIDNEYKNIDRFKQADTIGELCDLFILKNPKPQEKNKKYFLENYKKGVDK